MQLVLDGFLGLLFFIWIVRMQLRTRTLRQRTNPLFYVIIGLIGVIQIVTSVQHGTLKLNALTLSGLTLLAVFAITMGFLRAATLDIWQTNHQYFRKGNLKTIGMWLITLALHLLMIHFIHGTSSTSIAYLLLTLLSQNYVFAAKIKKISPMI
jgi:hypothetical protein